MLACCNNPWYNKKKIISTENVNVTPNMRSKSNCNEVMRKDRVQLFNFEVIKSFETFAVICVWFTF